MIRRLALVSLLFAVGLPWGGAPVAQAAAENPDESEFVYLLEDRAESSNRIYGYRIESVTGALRPLPGFPVSTGAAGDSGNDLMPVQRLAYSPASGRLFVLNDGSSNSVSVYAVHAQTGALSPLPYTISLGSGAWLCLSVHPSGSPLIVGGFQNNLGQAASYAVSASGATPAPGSPFGTGPVNEALPYHCAISPDGQQFITGGYGAERFAAFKIATSGALTALAGSPFIAGVSYPDAYAADGAGRVFLAEGSESGPHRLRVFYRSGGTLAPAAAPPIDAGIGQPLAGLWHPAGFYLVADWTSAAVGVYTISGSGASTTLTPVSGGPFDTIGGTGGLALTRSGGLLVVASLSTKRLTTYTFNQTSGALALQWEPATPLIAGSMTGMVVASPPPAPTHGYIYTLRDSASGSQIYGFRVNRGLGDLQALPGFPVTTGGVGGDSLEPLTNLMTRRLTVDRANNRLYAINNGSGTLSAFQIDPASGALSPLPFSPIALPTGNWYCLSVHPSGSPLLASGDTSGGNIGQVASFHMTGDSASPAPGSPYQVGGAVGWTCDRTQDGSLFYMALPDIMAYRVDPASGSLTALSGSPFNSGIDAVAGLAVDGNGRVLLADGGSVGTGSNVTYFEHLRAYHPVDGAPMPVSGNPFPSGLRLAIDGLWHPAGYYLVATPTFTTTYVIEAGQPAQDAAPTSHLPVFTKWGAVAAFRVQGSGAATTLQAAGQPVIAGAFESGSFLVGGRGVQTIALDHTGTLLFVANSATGAIASMRFDPASGALSARSQLPLGAIGGSGGAPSGLAFVPALPDLTLTSTVAEPFRPGGTGSYRLQVRNVAVASAVSSGPISVSSRLPAGVSYVGMAGTGWSCSASGATVTCSSSTRLIGGAALPNLTLMLAGSPGQSSTLVSSVALAGELATGNNSAQIAILARNKRVFLPLLRR